MVPSYERGIDFGVYFTTYVDRISKKDGSTICCGGLITAIAEHVRIATTNFTADMGEMFITYEVLFAKGLLKTDSSGQAFFIQTERDNFPVPIPYLTKVDTWDNKTMWKLNTQAHHRAIEANPMHGEFKKRNVPSRIPSFDPEEEDPTFDAIENFQEGEEQSNAQGGGVHHEDEEEVKDIEGHRRRNRANRRRGRPNANEEFQANTSACLGEMYSYMQNMSNTWDNCWAEQQQENDFNHQGWEAQGDWQSSEQDFWEAQRLQDGHQCQQLTELQRMAAEAQQERQTMSGDINYLIGAFDELNTRFPPPQE